MFSVFNGSDRSNTADSELSRFARPSLSQYATLICEQAGLRDLSQVYRAFCGDPGQEFGVRMRTHGSGYEFERGSDLDDTLRAGWVVFEKLPGDALRARVFKTVEGASAEFSAKLSLQTSGAVTMREFEAKPDSHRGRFLQVAFEGTGVAGECSMLMAPISTALDTATRLFYA